MSERPGMSEGMEAPTMAQAPAPAPATAQAPAVDRVNLMYHAIIGAAVGVTAAFTALAWPVAVGVGYVIGRDQVERMHGIKA